MTEPAATSLMLQESLDAPARIQEMLAATAPARAAAIAALQAEPPRFALTVGRGSSDHVCSFAAWSLARRLGLPTMSLQPSLVTRDGASLSVAGGLLLSVSQSGRGADVVAVVRWARRAGARTLAIVNDPASPLAAASEFVLDQCAGTEASVAATKSVLCSMAAVQALIAEWQGEPSLLDALASLPAELERAAAAGCDAPVEALATARQAFVLGRGAGLSIAQEIALKLKETCGLPAEALSAAEVRHGPREVVGPGFLVLALALGGPTENDIRNALGELAAQGAAIVTIGNRATDTWQVPASCTHNGPLAALQFAYPAIARAAVARGRDPDRPQTLSKVTSTF